MGEGKKKHQNTVVYIILSLGVLILLYSFYTVYINSGINGKVNTVEENNQSKEEDAPIDPSKIDKERLEVEEGLKTFLIEECQKLVKKQMGSIGGVFPTDEYYLIVKTTSDKKDEGYIRYTINSYFTLEEENQSPGENPNINFICVFDAKTENDPIYEIGVFLR